MYSSVLFAIFFSLLSLVSALPRPAHRDTGSSHGSGSTRRLHKRRDQLSRNHKIGTTVLTPTNVTVAPFQNVTTTLNGNGDGAKNITIGPIQNATAPLGNATSSTGPALPPLGSSKAGGHGVESIPVVPNQPVKVRDASASASVSANLNEEGGAAEGSEAGLGLTLTDSDDSEECDSGDDGGDDGGNNANDNNGGKGNKSSAVSGFSATPTPTASATASASSATPTGNSSDSNPITGYFYGGNSYYLHTFYDEGRNQILDAMSQAGMKTIRVFITQIAANNKGSSNQAVNDLEPQQVGSYDDSVLTMLDQLMKDASDRGMKLIIALGDRYALGFWNTDAYAYKFGIVSGGSGAQQVSDAANFYTDSSAITAYDNRISHILNHENKLMGNKKWSQLDEAIYAFEPQNEPMGHMDLVSGSWVCDRAGTIKKLTAGSGIKTTSGGGITLQDSLQGWAMNCKDIDVIAVHDYGTDPSSTVPALQAAAKQVSSQGKTVLFEEWGITGGDKANEVGSFVSALKQAKVSWMYWEVTNPGQGSSDYEVWTNEDSWSKLEQGGNAKSKRSETTRERSVVASPPKAKRSPRVRRSEASRRNSTPYSRRVGLGVRVVS